MKLLYCTCWFVSLAGSSGPDLRAAGSRFSLPTRLALTEPPSSLQESALSYADKSLTCRDCGQAFTFTVGEQEFHASKGFDERSLSLPGLPRRPQGRSGRQSGSYSSGSGSYRSDGWRLRLRGGYERQERQMYSATCSECGNEARVPFQPRGDRPVYCSDCFSKQRSFSR